MKGVQLYGPARPQPIATHTPQHSGAQAKPSSPTPTATQRFHDHSNVSTAISRIIAHNAFVHDTHGSYKHAAYVSPGDLIGFRNGEVRFPRLERLHECLSAPGGPEATVAVDNGPGNIAHLSGILAMMGSRVIIKEPDRAASDKHLANLVMAAGQGILGRIAYSSISPEIDRSIHADIAYWTNPAPGLLPDGSTTDVYYGESYPPHGLADYMGRNVKCGGYLVVQTDHDYFEDLLTDTPHWKTCYRELIGGVVLPTDFHWHPNTLIIGQRV